MITGQYLDLLCHSVPSTHTISPSLVFFFFNDTATTEIYTLSLHDALPISDQRQRPDGGSGAHGNERVRDLRGRRERVTIRSEEHTSELQSRLHLVCRLLLEKKKKKNKYST